MEGNFEIGKMGWYTPLDVAENTFLNEKLESDQYGIYYSVRFSGDAETYLWQAKVAPVQHERVWGHIEESKSGKSMRFKKDKQPDDEPASPTSANWKPPVKDKAYLKDLSDYPVRLYIGNLNYAKEAGLNLLEADDRRVYLEYIQNITDELLKYSEKIRE